VTETPYETVDFFPLDQKLHDDFWNQLTDVREKCPVGWATSYWSMTAPPGQWIINTYADNMNAASDWETFSSQGGVSSVQFPLDVIRLIPVENDPPVHREIRKALNPFFTPAALADNDGELQKIADELMDRCLEQAAGRPGPVDFVELYTSQLPPLVLLGPNFLDQDTEQGAELLGLVRILLTKPELTLETAPKLLAWCGALLERRRAEGRRDDLPGMIAHLGLDDPDFQLSERERVETLNLTVMAGMETTMGGMGAAAWLLATRPELVEALRGTDERTLDRAIEEILRYSSPVPTEGRTLTRDVEVGGCPMKAGDRVLLNFAAANLDPEKFPDPHALDINRPNVASHLAFGAGIHRCLGAHLARREMKVTIKAILALSEFRFDPEQEIRFRASFARGPVALPVYVTR